MQSGVFLIIVSMSLTPFGDALSKYLGDTQSPMFIVFLRYFVAGLIALVLARATGAPVSLPRRGRAGFVARTALVMGAMAFLIVALTMIPLATAVGGFLIAPIIATLISVIVYHEALTLPRIVGAGASFLGALLILRPNGALDLGIIFALTGGLLLGGFLALSRAARVTMTPVSALAVQCLMGSAMLFPFAVWQMGTLNMALIAPALGLGGITAATHFLTVAAYQRTEAAKLAPFFYFNLVAAVIVGLIWFHEVPGGLTLGGLGLIGAGGLLNLIEPRWMSAAFRRLRPFGSANSPQIYAKNR